MVVDCGGDDQLVRLGLGDDRLEAFVHRVRGPDVRAAQDIRDVVLLGGGPVRLDVVDGRRELTPAAANDIQERLLRRGEQPFGRRVVVRCDDVHSDHRVGLIELRRGLEARAVHLERRQQQIRREVRGERIGETERRRQLCAGSKSVGVNRPGAFAEYLALPMTNVWVHRPGIDLEVAAIFDPFGNAVHTALAFEVHGEDVLISGAGPIGLMAIGVVRHAGARHVVVSEPIAFRRGIAEQMGATLTVDPGQRNLRDV